MTVPRLADLLELFPEVDILADADEVSALAVPEPYHTLLVHDQHMTVTVEAHHGGPVDVTVLATRADGELYSRKILLVCRATGKVVQFGIVRIDLAQTSPHVRAAILAQDTPLGRVLIEHDVMRRIEPTAFVRINPGPEPSRWFGREVTKDVYGRLALIHCDGRPAVELLEVVAPE